MRHYKLRFVGRCCCAGCLVIDIQREIGAVNAAYVESASDRRQWISVCRSQLGSEKSQGRYTVCEFHLALPTHQSVALIKPKVHYLDVPLLVVAQRFQGFYLAGFSFA